MSEAIVVVHGALGSAAQMQPIADALRLIDGVERDVHLVELPGHGESPLERDHDLSVDHFADVLATTLATRGLVTPLCFGYSMGGYVALALEARAPNTFGGIISLGTKFAWTPDAAAREVRRLDAQKLREKVPHFAAMLEARHANAGGWETVLARTASLLTSIGAAPVLTDAVLAQITVPVIVAAGSKDDTVPADECANAARACGGRYVLLEGAGHPIESVPLPEVVRLVRLLIASR